MKQDAPDSATVEKLPGNRRSWRKPVYAVQNIAEISQTHTCGVGNDSFGWCASAAS